MNYYKKIKLFMADTNNKKIDLKNCEISQEEEKDILEKLESESQYKVLPKNLQREAGAEKQSKNLFDDSIKKSFIYLVLF